MSYRKLCLVIAILSLSTLNSKGQISQTEMDKIQIAFLLDVSGSMDQLILKAKSQFWRMADYLQTGTKRGKKPTVEFALIIYGSDVDISKVLTDFNSDLDSVAINLHEIEIGGSREYCWTSIDMALDSLTWSNRKGDLKLIIIAGNESFTQEEIDSKKVTKKVKKLNVVINTIYCSAMDDSMSSEWRKAAEQGNGNYFTISLNDSISVKNNPLDNKLSNFNDKLNETYIPFGTNGQKGYNRMILQDKNSSMAGIPFFRARIIYKASDSFLNPTWDLVDAFKSDSTILDRLDKFERSENLQLNSTDELKEFMLEKLDLRESYKEVIRRRYEMIKNYLGENKGDKDLDAVVKEIIDKEGRKRNFEFRR